MTGSGQTILQMICKALLGSAQTSWHLSIFIYSVDRMWHPKSKKMLEVRFTGQACEFIKYQLGREQELII